MWVLILLYLILFFFFRKNEDPSKPGKSENSNNDKSEFNDIERTSSNNHEAVETENVSSTKPKGKRLKIVEVDGENEPETSAIPNGESNIDETSNKSSNDTMDQEESIQRTTDSDNLQPADKPLVEKQPQLPGLVLKAQKEGTRLFKLGRYAEAAEQFTQAVDILQKSKEGNDKYSPYSHFSFSKTLVQMLIPTEP